MGALCTAVSIEVTHKKEMRRKLNIQHVILKYKKVLNPFNILFELHWII